MSSTNYDEVIDHPDLNKKGLRVEKPPWNPKIIVVITLIFLLPGGILYALNFERLGLKSRKIPNLITFCLLFLVVFLANLSNQFKPINMINFALTTYCAIHFYKTQNYLYKRHIEAGGNRSSCRLPVLVTILSFVPVFSIGFGFQSMIDNKYYQAHQFYAAGDFGNAEKYFKIYKQFNKDEPAPYYSLAMVYVETGRIDLAKVELKSYLRLNRGDQEVEGILKELNEITKK